MRQTAVTCICHHVTLGLPRTWKTCEVPVPARRVTTDCTIDRQASARHRIRNGIGSLWRCDSRAFQFGDGPGATASTRGAITFYCSVKTRYSRTILESRAQSLAVKRATSRHGAGCCGQTTAGRASGFGPWPDPWPGEHGIKYTPQRSTALAILCHICALHKRIDPSRWPHLCRGSRRAVGSTVGKLDWPCSQGDSVVITKKGTRQVGCASPPAKPSTTVVKHYMEAY